MNALFHHDVVMAPLGSGSRGNCTFIGTSKRGVLIDCGLSTKQIFLRMEQAGLADAHIDGVLVTHEHGDHVASARVLERRICKEQGSPVPFWMTPGTWEGVRPQARPSMVEAVTPGILFEVGGYTIEPVAVPHDTADPVAYSVCVGPVRATVLTDLGRTTNVLERLLAESDLALVEFNHDKERLMDGGYPWSLKQRILGPHGHLSNAQAADLVTKGARPRLKHLFLGHLSDENNSPELARRSAEQALWAAGCRETVLTVARQEAHVGPARIEAPADLPKSRRTVARPSTRRSSTEAYESLQEPLFKSALKP